MIQPNTNPHNQPRPRLNQVRPSLILADLGELLERMREDGCDPCEPLKHDGHFHQFNSTEDSQHGCDGWYIIVGNRAHYGDWRKGTKFTAFYNGGCLRAPPWRQKAVIDEAYAAARRAQAEQIWAWAPEAPDDHAYLVRKGIKAHGTKFYNGRKVFAEIAMRGALVVPIYDDDVRLQAIELIRGDGQKRNIGPVRGGHFWIGDPVQGDTLLIAEGFATAASVFERTGAACACAFGVGNLWAAARYVRNRFDPKWLVLVADGDEPGIKAANEAARAMHALVFYAEPGLDYNDMVNGGRP